MNEHSEISVGRGYAAGQLARALVTASAHEDAETRRRAAERVRRWEQVLAAMAAGNVSVGARAPVAGLPGWVTLEVVRGGFATGGAAAGGPLLPREVAEAAQAGIPAERRALFLRHLSEEGMADLTELLDSRRYQVAVPEEAALLTVAWLVRAGDRPAALELLETLDPFSDRLLFGPMRTDEPMAGPETVHRQTVAEVGDQLAGRKPNLRVAAMREALTVWNPFADELLAHWLETVQDGQVGARMPPGWQDRGRDLLDRYRALAEAHTWCSKHRNPKENLAILRTALQQSLNGAAVQPGLLQHAVDSMLRRRGVPGSPSHTALRSDQAANAAHPTHHALAQLLLSRLSALPQQTGTTSTDTITAPVTADESRRSELAQGTAIPAPLVAVVERTLSAPVETLMERGIVPSAEVLAELVPQLVASTTALAYPDDALRSLMAANYRAFRNRRSLLLLNLEHQIQIEELPWVQAAAPYRSTCGAASEAARTALVRLSELALQGFPATILPNPLVSELAALAATAQLDVPLVEELAADIFMGTFSAKYLRAAKLAADLMSGSLYERYYGIDYQAVTSIDDVTQRHGFAARSSEGFAALCFARAGTTQAGYSVAANGMVIEQAQILTTHNLAALAGPIGVQPSPGWAHLAYRSFVTTCTLIGRVHNNPRPLGTIKDAAYAWRQMIFFLSRTAPDAQTTFLRTARDELNQHPQHAITRLGPALAGLEHVLTGGTFTQDGSAGTARRFLGWQTSRHWIQQTG